jgi:hypothetical protein
MIQEKNSYALISINVRQKLRRRKKNLTKNLKIGLKLQKNLDTKKFGLVKKLTYCSG